MYFSPFSQENVQVTTPQIQPYLSETVQTDHHARKVLLHRAQSPLSLVAVYQFVAKSRVQPVLEIPSNLGSIGSEAQLESL